MKTMNKRITSGYIIIKDGVLSICGDLYGHLGQINDILWTRRKLSVSVITFLENL